MKRFKRRTWILLGVLVVAAIAAVSSYAYFTAPGSGFGSAQTGQVANITLTSVPVSGLWPDSVNHNVTVVATNTGQGPQYIGTVTGTVANQGGCFGGWFVVDPLAYNATVPVGNTNLGTTTMHMFDSGGDQTACANLTLTINWLS